MCLFQLTTIHEYHSSFQRVKDISESFHADGYTYIIAYEQRGTQTEGVLYTYIIAYEQRGAQTESILFAILTSLPMSSVVPRLKAFSLPSSRTSMCWRIPSPTFQVTVRWSELCKKKQRHSMITKYKLKFKFKYMCRKHQTRTALHSNV